MIYWACLKMRLAGVLENDKITIPLLSICSDPETFHRIYTSCAGFFCEKSLCRRRDNISFSGLWGIV